MESATLALEAAGDHPLAAHFRQRLEELRVGPVEAAARAAWGGIELRVKAKTLSAAAAKGLLGKTAEFETRYSETKFAASVADELAAAKRRAERAIAAVVGLVGHWRFDEGRGDIAADSSGYGSHGMIEGATWTAGRLGASLGFDGGSSQVLIARSEEVNLGTADFTIAAWIVTTEEFGTFLAKSPPGGSWERGGKILYLRRGSLQFDAHSVGFVSSKARVNDGRWHHVAVTFENESKTARLFMDGMGDGERRLELLPDGPEHVVRIGFSPRGCFGRRNFRGLVDDVRIYKRVLSGQDVRALAASSGPVSDPTGRAASGAGSARR
jgi:hypothetical protein